MRKFLSLFTDSYREFRHVNTITTCAVFGAMSVLLGYYSIRVLSLIHI